MSNNFPSGQSLPVLQNDFKAQWAQIREAALGAFDRVGKSGWLILGKEVADFEQALAKDLGVPHVIGCANGLDAIEISLRSLGLKPNEKVLTTPLSAFATTLAILRAGGVPVFVDVDQAGLLDLQRAEQFFTVNSDVRFMVPVHLYGHAIDLKKLKFIKDKFNLKVVEDCAQSIGAKSSGVSAGTVGQMAATSFYPTKNLGCMGDGGAIFTFDTELANQAKVLRDYGQSEKYRHSTLGLNSRLDEVQAAVLKDALLPLLKAGTEVRRMIAKQYLARIKNPHITFPCVPSSSESVWHLFPLLIARNRKAFQEHLLKAGIHNGIHYPVLITDQEALINRPLERFENAERFSKHVVSIPVHPLLSEQEIERVIQACNSWGG